MLKIQVILFVIFQLVFNITRATSQDLALSVAPYAPSQVINDLLVDKRGFLWIASDLGVTRYDGTDYTTFTDSLQHSLGSSGLIEDKQGKIWFSNFTGQIFYIDHESMYLFKGYNANKENSFPRMVLFRGQLIVSSDKGLFSINTVTLKGNYIESSNNSSSPTSSIAIFKNEVIAYGNSNWFVYKPDGSFKKIKCINCDINPSSEILTLNNNTYRDTAYMFSNPSGTVSKIVAIGDSLKVCNVKRYNGFINSVTINGNEQWVNTTGDSYSINSNRKLINYSISDIVTDKEGNTWFGTIGKGIFVKYREKTPHSFYIPLLQNDNVISTVLYKNNLLLGTQNGKLLTFDIGSKKLLQNINLTGNSGSVNTINASDNETFVIGCSINTYLVNLKKNKVILLPAVKTVKQVFKTNGLTLIASASKTFIIPGDYSDSSIKQFSKQFGEAFKFDNKSKWYFLDKGSSGICYWPETKSIIVIFNDGVYEISHDGVKPLLFQNRRIYAASLCYANNKLCIGTINNGLLIFEKTRVKHILGDNGLLSTTIFKFKLIANHLWIIGTGALQMLDMQSLKFTNRYELPPRKLAQVTDVEEMGKSIYVTTTSGVLTFRDDTTIIESKPENYLLAVKVNDIYNFNTSKLSYRENNISFKIGIPSFKWAQDMYIKYCLIRGIDSTWHMTEPGERIINFYSLMPGSYKFKAYAVDPKWGAAGSAINYQFTILLPWWKRAWFFFIILISVLLSVSYVTISYQLNKLAFKKAYKDQQDSIHLERQRISSEIHDDIGSGLFAIHLFADLASKKTKDVEDVRQISTMVKEISEKIREIIWSTNIENDNLENLIYYIQFQITGLFEHSDIHLQSSIPENIPYLNVANLARRNIYLISKELAHNTIKHSRASKVFMGISIENGLLRLRVKDNGIGIDFNKVSQNGMGLENVKDRVKKLEGSLSIVNNKGTDVTIQIPLDAASTLDIDDTMEKSMKFLLRLLKRSVKETFGLHGKIFKRH